jgi:hypothetical protein
MKPTVLSKLEEWYPLGASYKQKEAVAGHEATQLENLLL